MNPVLLGWYGRECIEHKHDVSINLISSHYMNNMTNKNTQKKDLILFVETSASTIYKFSIKPYSIKDIPTKGVGHNRTVVLQ